MHWDLISYNSKKDVKHLSPLYLLVWQLSREEVFHKFTAYLRIRKVHVYTKITYFLAIIVSHNYVESK